MKNKFVIAGAALAAVLVAAVVALTFLLDANQFRPKLEGLMGDALGRTVTIANVKVALFSGGISIEGLSIADDPAFSREPFVTAKAVSVGVDLMPLLLSRSLRVQSFRLDQPRVVLRRSMSGAWNFSSLGSGGGTTTAMSVLVQKVKIAGGRIVVGHAGRTDDERTYDDVDVEVSDLSYTAPFPFRVTAKTPGGGTATFDGQAGPFNTKDAAETPFHATVTLKQVDIASTGFVEPASGVGGMLDFAGSLTSDGVRVTTTGTVTATKVQLLAGGAASRVPIVVDYESSFETKTEHGALTRGDVHVGKAVAHLTGDYNTSGKTPALRMRLAGKQMPVTELEAALPAIGVTLPSGASLKQGTLDADLAISGPADHLVITGPINVANGTLAGFDLGARLGALGSFAGLSKGGDTVIETLSATLRAAPEGIQVDALNMQMPATGTLTGAGTIAPNGAIAFKMLAKLKDGAGGALPGSVARIATFAQTSGIPFRVQGTTSNPVFVPDIGGAVQASVADALKNPETAREATDLLGGLFGRKK